MPPLISEEEMYAMDSGHESDDKPMYTDMLEDISDVSKSNLHLNRRESRYKIRDHIKRSHTEFKGALLSTQNMGKGLHKVFKAVVNDISQVYQLLVNMDQKFPILFQNP